MIKNDKQLLLGFPVCCWQIFLNFFWICVHVWCLFCDACSIFFGDVYLLQSTLQMTCALFTFAFCLLTWEPLDEYSEKSPNVRKPINMKENITFNCVSLFWCVFIPFWCVFPVLCVHVTLPLCPRHLLFGF